MEAPEPTGGCHGRAHPEQLDFVPFDADNHYYEALMLPGMFLSMC